VSSNSESTREQRLRRTARRRDLCVTKSRSDGTYMIVDPFVNTIVAGDTSRGYGLSLGDIEEWLLRSREV
jgi:hypothetical protein